MNTDPSAPVERRKTSRRKFIALALFTVFGTSIGRLTSPDADLPKEQVIATDFGEWRDVQLMDGTMATLGPRTSITVRFDSKQRHVYLGSGDVLVKVTKDRARPFIVETSHARARALGTTFAVSRNADRTNVTTIEGLVGVVRRSDEPGESRVASVKVAANQSVTVDRWAQRMKVRTVDPWIELAWTKRQIAFVGTWLPAAIEEFNRRNRLQIAVPNTQQTLKIRVTGRFQLDDPKAFSRYVEAAMERRALDH